jgi:hypothetical protein
MTGSDCKEVIRDPSIAEKQTEKDDGSEKWIVIAVVGAVIFLLIILLVLLIVWRRKRGSYTAADNLGNVVRFDNNEPTQAVSVSPSGAAAASRHVYEEVPPGKAALWAPGYDDPASLKGTNTDNPNYDSVHVVAVRGGRGTFAPSADNRPVYDKPKPLPKVENIDNPTYGTSGTETGTVPEDSEDE